VLGRAAYLVILAVSLLCAALLNPHADSQAAEQLVLSDGFETGDMSNWDTVTVAGDATATVQSNLVHTGVYAARLSSTLSSSARAFARAHMEPEQPDLRAAGAFNIQAEGASGANVPFFRFFDSAGNRVISLYRQNGSGGLWVKHSGAYHSTGRVIALAAWHRLELRATVGPPASGIVEIGLDGALVYTTASATLGTAPIADVQLGNETAAQAYVLIADEINVTVAGTAPTGTPASSAGATPTATPSASPTDTPTPTPATSSTPSASTGNVVLGPIDDAYVAGELPNSNFGLTPDLQSDASPVRESYLKFDLRPFSNVTISLARLRMYVTNGSSGAQSVRPVASNTWSEATLTYNNRPAKGAAVASFTPSSTKRWIEVVVTSLANTGAGSFLSLAIDSGSQNGYDFNSAEAASNRVELVVQWGEGAPSTTPAPTPTPTPAPASFSFGATGDLGATSNTSAVLNAAKGANLNFFLAAGDLSYSDVTPESAWCDFVKARVGSSFPFELVAGNHEDDGPDGLISKFDDCLPHRLGSLSGAYAKQYYFDYPSTNPIARFINISPNLTFPGEGTWSYSAGGSRYNWTATTIDQARAAGIKWVIVTMHKYCISMVSGSCQIGSDIMNLLISKKVDLYLQAHDHAFYRSKQLAHRTGCSAISPGSYDADCVAYSGSDGLYSKGGGTVIITAGAGGKSINSVSTGDPEAGYFAKWMGSNFNPTYGFLKVTVSTTKITAQFVRGAGGTYTDSFTIQ
jgi:hypothetical protein